MTGSTRPNRRLVSIAEAAAYTGLCGKTIRRRMSDGTLTGVRLGTTRSIRVDLDELDRALAPIPAAGGAE